MSIRCTLRRVSPRHDAVALLTDPTEADVSASSDVLDLDKAWHGLHYLLTGDAVGGDPPAAYLLVGGQELADDAGAYGPPRYLPPAEVRGWAATLGVTDVAALARRFAPVVMDELEIYPAAWGGDPDTELRWLLNAYDRLRAYVVTAADAGDALVVTYE